MIQSTFVFLQGIGIISERKLWDDGIETWVDFLNASAVPRVSAQRKTLYDEEVSAALEHFRREDPHFFARRLKPRDQWRLYEWLRPRAVYLDIETAGGPFGEVTVVGLYAEGRMMSLVRGESLTEERLCSELSRYGLIVTFFGSGFDIPYLHAMFPRLSITHPHLDLCFAARQLGLRGGLKQIERAVGIERAGPLQGMDGWDAVRLWTRWRHSRDAKARELLLAYNEADCVNLEPLADLLYCRLVQEYRPEGMSRH